MATIKQGVVLHVDTQAHLATVQLEFDDSPILVRLGRPYGHASNGQGIFVLPEVGSVCLVAWPDDGSRPFIVSYVMPPGSGEQLRGGSQDAAPGDIVIAGSERNYVSVDANGVVKVVATDLASMMLFPVENLIRLVFEKFQMLSPGGQLVWINEQKAAKFEFSLGEASGATESIVIRAGTLPDSQHAQGLQNSISGNIVLEALVGDKLFGFHIDNAGQSTIETKKMGLVVRSTYEISVNELFLLRAAQVNFQIQQTLDITCPNVTIKSGSTSILGNINLGNLLTIGNGEIKVKGGSGQPLVKYGPLVNILSILASATRTTAQISPLLSQLATTVFKE